MCHKMLGSTVRTCRKGEGIARQRRAIIDGLRVQPQQEGPVAKHLIPMAGSSGYFQHLRPATQDSITHGSGETLSTEKISELLLITQHPRAKDGQRLQSQCCPDRFFRGTLKLSEMWPRPTDPAQYSFRADRGTRACRSSRS